MIRYSLISLVLVFSLNLFAKTPKSAKPIPQKSNFQTFRIGSKDLMQAFKMEMPNQLCDSKSKMSQCHKMTKKKCQEVAKASFVACEKKGQQARQLSSVEAIQFGESMGLCVGEKMRFSLKHLKKKNCE